MSKKKVIRRTIPTAGKPVEAAAAETDELDEDAVDDSQESDADVDEDESEVEAAATESVEPELESTADAVVETVELEFAIETAEPESAQSTAELPIAAPIAEPSVEAAAVSVTPPKPVRSAPPAVTGAVTAAMYADPEYVQNNSPFYPVAEEAVAAVGGKVVGFIDILLLVQIAIALANVVNGCIANSRLQRMVKSAKSTEHDQVRKRLKRQLASKLPESLAEDYKLRLAGELLNRAADMEQPHWDACTTYAKGIPA